MKSSFSAADVRLAEVLAGSPVAANELESLAHLAIERRVGGAFLRRVAASGVVAPDPVAGLLEEARDVAAGRNLWLSHAARTLSERLAAEGIPHRIVKGIALLPWLAHPGDRWLVDADLLVGLESRRRVAERLEALGLSYRSYIRHDGRPSRPERDGSTAEVLGAHGAPLELHFTARLPDATPGTHVVTVEALAAGLSDHVLRHHGPDPHLLLRHVADLRALIDAGHVATLCAASEGSPALERALAWMSALGTPELRGVVAPRGIEDLWSTRLRLARIARRLRALAHDGVLLRSLYPSASYLEAHHGSSSRWRRWRAMFHV